MKTEQLRKTRDRAPFKSFRIHLTNGEILSVAHPEMLSLPANQAGNLFVVWQGIDPHIVEMEQVAQISPQKKTKSSAK